MPGKYPPGPSDRFFGFSLYDALFADPVAFVRKVWEDYGDYAFAQVGWVRLYFVNRPELIREVLTTKQKSFHKLGRQMRSLRQIEGDGLVVAEGKTWARHRPVVQGSFHARFLQGYARTVVEHTLRRIQRWPVGQPFDLASEMNELAMEIIGKVVFSADLGGDTERLRDAVHKFRAAMQREVSSPLPIPDWLPLRWKFEKRAGLRVLNEFLWKHIHARRASGEFGHDVLGQMLRAAAQLDVRPPISDLEIRDEASTLFVAGHDTTSASLAWLWYAVSTHPEVEQRILAEVASLQGQPPTYEDLPRLKYTEMTVKEVMRLYPASYFLFGREAVEDVELGGYPMRKGAWIFIAPYIVHRDPRLFADPEKFDPERFAPGRFEEIPPYSYIPFGGGPRICIGNAFAVMEMTLLTATVLQKYRLQLDQAQVEREFEVVMRPRGGLRMIAHPRAASVESLRAAG